MNYKRLLVFVALCCIVAGQSFGAVVGKISGVITDAQTKEPLVGVSVSVVGTTMGAMTDANGVYNIINVPVGTYTLRITSIGYSALEVTNVEVSADLTSYQSQAMTSQVTEVGTTQTVRAERPLIIKDKTTSINVVKRDDILAMPTRGFEQVVGLQNSVVRMKSNVDVRQRGQREATAGLGSELNLRGGRPSEVAYYVDGFSQQDPLSGLSTANINNNAIKEVSVVAGSFSAEYGHVSSGIVNVVTNSGGKDYHGNLEVVTDNWQGAKNSYDQNYYSGDFSGPIPGMEKGSFFFSGERRWLGDREPSSVQKDMVEANHLESMLGDNFQRLPNNSLSGWSWQGKLDYNFTPNLKLGLSTNGSQDIWQEYRHVYLFDLAHNPKYKDLNAGYNAKLTHTLNASTFYNVSLSYFKTYRFRGDGVAFDDLNKYDLGHVNIEEDAQNLFFQDGSYWPNYLKRHSSYVGMKGDITHRVNDKHTLRGGFDLQRHTLRYFENLDATQFWSGTPGVWDSNGVPINLNRYGYDAYGNETDDDGFLNNVKHPINLGVFLEDHFEFRDLVINAGLRLDYFDYKALRVKDLQNPLGPAGPGSTTIDRSDLTESKKFTRVSPRIGVGFPVSDKTQLHVNYGKFFQRPDLRRLYVGYDFLAARITGGSYYPFPSPNLEPEKTTQYEFGVSHQLGDHTAINLTAYYKDVEDLTQIFHQTPAFPQAYDFFANTDYGTIKGMDLEFTMKRTQHVQLNLKYTLSYATGTGSYAQSQYIVAWQNPQNPPKTTSPLDYDQRHSLVGLFDWRTGAKEGPRLGDTYLLENTGVNLIVQAASGTPYTPTAIDNEITLAAYTPRPSGYINSQNLPWTFSIDLKIERTIKLGKYSMVPYVLVRNLLDRKNVLSVYEGTGKADETGWLPTPEGQVFVDQFGDSEYLVQQYNPKNYSNPRMILLGVRMSF